MELWEQINANQYAMKQSLRSLRPNYEAWAKADTEYHIAKSKKILELDAQGMSKTLINDIVKGLPDVAELDLKRKIAEGTYKANFEAINVYKQEAQTLRMYYEKEYTNAEIQR